MYRATYDLDEDRCRCGGNEVWDESEARYECEACGTPTRLDTCIRCGDVIPETNVAEVADGMVHVECMYPGEQIA